MNPFKDLVDEVVRLGVPVAPETWSACIYIAASREFFRLGIACLEKMVETGTLPDGKAFNQIMACCEKKGRAEEAMYLFNFMREHGVEVPPLTYWYRTHACTVVARPVRASSSLFFFVAHAH